MKATGIVRRIDDLGRVIIPKELRRTLKIREGDPLEIFIDNDGNVIFKKYTYFGDFDYKKAMNVLKPFLSGTHFALYNNYLEYVCGTDRATFQDEFTIDYDCQPENCYEIVVLNDTVAYLYIKDEVQEELKNASINALKAFFTDY
jgi:stage V sporulation protein T